MDCTKTGLFFHACQQKLSSMMAITKFSMAFTLAAMSIHFVTIVWHKNAHCGLFEQL